MMLEHGKEAMNGALIQVEFFSDFAGAERMIARS
jgi:hypothetical protein